MVNAKKDAERLAQLEAEIAALKAAQPKPEPSWEERERAAAKWRDEMHQMREGRMSLATPPSVVREFAVLDDALVKGIALRDSRAPTGPNSQGAIPSSQQVSNVHTGGVPGGGTGWQAPTPLGPPPGVAQADRLMDAQDARDRAELIERDANLKAMEKVLEQSEKLQRLIEQNKKLMEKTK